MQKLVKAREARGWSKTELSKRAEVPYQSVANLECGRSVHGPVNPGNVAVRTAIKLCEALWPDLELRDFIPATRFDLQPRDRKMRRELKIGAQFPAKFRGAS